MLMDPYSQDVIDRFMRKVIITPDCWVWDATIDRYGYGQFYLLRKTRKAHRISFEIHRGEIPEGLHLDHTCRNRDCVNPSHLEAVTTQENTRRGIEARLELCTNS